MLQAADSFFEITFKKAHPQKTHIKPVSYAYIRTRYTSVSNVTSTAVCSTNGQLQWALCPSESRMTFPEVLCLRRCAVNRLMNKSVLMLDEFRLMYTSDPRSKPSPKSSSVDVTE